MSKPKGLAYASGPCAFTPEGDLWVNCRTTGTDVDSHIVKIDPDGNVLVHRTTSGGVGVNVNTLTAIDMIATKDGGIVWGGQDCVGERPVYCQDGLIVRLDREGNEVNEWRYGTPGVIDRSGGGGESGLRPVPRRLRHEHEPRCRALAGYPAGAKSLESKSLSSLQAAVSRGDLFLCVITTTAAQLDGLRRRLPAAPA